VTEVLISFQRPASMTESEMRAWITERARTRQPQLALAGPDGSESQPQLLRVEVRADSIEAAEEQLTDLMMDMRLLGLRPTVVPAPGDGL
jgi:hypothetical protein